LADTRPGVVNNNITAEVFAPGAGHALEHTLRRLRTWRLAEGERDTLRVNPARGHLDLGQGRL
jgi:hypothetical protein